MTISIMQPTYLPWVGYFDLMDQVNKFVFLDSVQLSRRSWQTKNRIYTKQGEFYLTVPIQKTKTRDETYIFEGQICNLEKWRDKHLRTIEHAYKKTVYFSEVFTFLHENYGHSFTFLGDFNINLIENIAYKIGITTKLYRSSEMNINGSRKDILLSRICGEMGCQDYLSTIGSYVYIESASPGGAFLLNNIQLYYHNYTHPIYRQSRDPFTPYMCILDLLFNEGFSNSLNIIKSGRRDPIYYEQFRKDKHETLDTNLHGLRLIN